MTPCSRVLLEKLIVTQLVKKIPVFYGIRRFITVYTRSRLWSLSWARCIQFTPSSPIFRRSILILSFHLHLGLPSGLFPSGYPTTILYTFLISFTRATWSARFIILDLITLITFGKAYKLWSSPLCSILQPPVTSSLLGPNILLIPMDPSVLFLYQSDTSAL
jgi:hypothetical protein